MACSVHLGYFTPVYRSGMSISSTFKSTAFGVALGSSLNVPFKSLADPRNRDMANLPVWIVILENHASDKRFCLSDTAFATTQTPSALDRSCVAFSERSTPLSAVAVARVTAEINHRIFLSIQNSLELAATAPGDARSVYWTSRSVAVFPDTPSIDTTAGYHERSPGVPGVSRASPRA
jgi:hypothetical protein